MWDPQSELGVLAVWSGVMPDGESYIDHELYALVVQKKNFM